VKFENEIPQRKENEIAKVLLLGLSLVEHENLLPDVFDTTPKFSLTDRKRGAKSSL